MRNYHNKISICFRASRKHERNSFSNIHTEKVAWTPAKEVHINECLDCKDGHINECLEGTYNYCIDYTTLLVTYRITSVDLHFSEKYHFY